jgi:hypothetical protein
MITEMKSRMIDRRNGMRQPPLRPQKPRSKPLPPISAKASSPIHNRRPTITNSERRRPSVAVV